MEVRTNSWTSFSSQSQTLPVFHRAHITQRCFYPFRIIPCDVIIDNLNERFNCYSDKVLPIKHLILHPAEKSPHCSGKSEANRHKLLCSSRGVLELLVQTFTLSKHHKAAALLPTLLRFSSVLPMEGEGQAYSLNHQD